MTHGQTRRKKAWMKTKTISPLIYFLCCGYDNYYREYNEIPVFVRRSLETGLYGQVVQVSHAEPQVREIWK